MWGHWGSAVASDCHWCGLGFGCSARGAMATCVISAVAHPVVLLEVKDDLFSACLALKTGLQPHNLRDTDLGPIRDWIDLD